jgi:predicted transcriptional regulator
MSLILSSVENEPAPALIDTHPKPSYPRFMTVQLTAEQEVQLSRIAEQSGRAVDELAREAVDRYLAEDAHFRAAVQEGLDAVDRGEFVPASEVWDRVERELQS